MKHRILLAFLFITPLILAQEGKESDIPIPYKQQIGIQLNPYFDRSLIDGYMMEVVFGFRYSYNVTPQFSSGPDVSGFTPVYFKSGDNVNHFKLGIGAFARYSFLESSRVRIFTEFIPFYSYWYREETQFITEKRETRFGICLSPGVTLFSKSRKFSLDLYMKFSNIDFVNSKNYVFSYKMNYHF